MLTLAGGLACESSPEPAAAPAPVEEPAVAPPPPLDVFSAERVWGDLEALVGIGPRVSGSEGSTQARSYLTGELVALGLQVDEVETTRSIEGLPDETLRHLRASLPGASPRRLVLAAPYDSSHFADFTFVGANDGASGAALLLELARVLSTRSLPYTTDLLFFDGEGRAPVAEGTEGVGERWHGSRGVAAAMRASGELDQVRLLVAFHQVCDADLAIARDLASHRMHREEFFKAARRLSRAPAFPRGDGFESPEASHHAFRDQGLRSVVAITDTRFGGLEVPGVYAETAEDTLAHCAQESLEAVGVVSLEALETIGQRLAKIDRFTHAPLAEAARDDLEAADREPAASDEPAPAPGEGEAEAPLETSQAAPPASETSSSGE